MFESFWSQVKQQSEKYLVKHEDWSLKIKYLLGWDCRVNIVKYLSHLSPSIFPVMFK